MTQRCGQEPLDLKGYVGESERDLSGVPTKVGNGVFIRSTLAPPANSTRWTFRVFQHSHHLYHDYPKSCLHYFCCSNFLIGLRVFVLSPLQSIHNSSSCNSLKTCIIGPLFKALQVYPTLLNVKVEIFPMV